MTRSVQTNGGGIDPHPGSLSSRMDVPRKGYRKRRWRNRILFAAGLVITIGALTLLISRLKPALPSVLLVLSSAELEQQTLDSDAAVKSAQAKFTQLQAQLEGELLERQAALTKAKADRDTATVEMEVDDRLAKRGLIASLDFKKAQITAAELVENFEVEKQRYDFAKQSMEPRLALAQGDLDQAKAQAALHHGQVDTLQVRAGMNVIPTCVP
jgi:hypothetical protein